jgi:hypothetical protein
MTEQERKWFNEYIRIYPNFAEKYLRIKTKDGKIIPFKFNNAQRKVDKIVNDTISAGKKQWFIVLKARQEGISTYFSGRGFWRNMTRKFWKTAVVGHVKDASNNLFDMIKRFYQYLEPALQPELQASNEKKLAFSILESEMKVSTAEGGESVGRSDNYQDLILTEVAFWRNAKETLVALLQTIGAFKDSMIVLESTANGVGGDFYDRWQAAKKGESDFTPIFLAWFELDEYKRDFINEEEKKTFETSLSDEERERIKLYNLSLEQANWYRYQLINYCGGDKLKMQQEYPCNDVEAFVSSGNPVFDQKICARNYELAKGELKRGNLEWVGKEVVFRENPRGYVRLYKNIDVKDEEMYRYAAGVDVAEGLAQGDYSYVKVLDRKDSDVALVWHGHIDPDLLADEIHKIQTFLKKKIFFAIEKNNHGFTTIKSSYKLGVNLYHNQTFDKGYPSDSGSLGFTTTSKSKSEVINDLNEWIREGIFFSDEKEFWSECMIFVRNERGQMQAQGKDEDKSVKSYDDRVMGGALMVRCALWMPNFNIVPKKEPVARPFFEEQAYEIDYATF